MSECVCVREYSVCMCECEYGVCVCACMHLCKLMHRKDLSIPFSMWCR